MSVEAPQLRVIDVVVTLAAATPGGAEGAVRSLGAGAVVVGGGEVVVARVVVPAAVVVDAGHSDVFAPSVAIADAFCALSTA